MIYNLLYVFIVIVHILSSCESLTFRNTLQMIGQAQHLSIKVLGHRGEGASDAPFHRNRDHTARVVRFPEGTVASQRQCFLNGADGFEMDVISTADHNVVSCHADKVEQHVLVDYPMPEKSIGKMKTYQVREIPVGALGLGRIPTFEDVLQMVLDEFPHGMINVELKDKIDNMEDDALTSPSLAQLVASKVNHVKFPLNQLIFSSFSHRYLLDLRAEFSDARVGVLYDPLPQPQPLYLIGDGMNEHLDYRTSLSISSLEKSLELIPNLYSVHAEISSLTAETVKWIANHNLVLATWARDEYSPAGDTENTVAARDRILHAVKLCEQEGVKELLIITDHVRDVRALLRDAHTRR